MAKKIPKTGQFKPGNPGGPGRPAREKEKTYLLALSEAVPLDRWRRIAERAAEDAEKGDHRSREWLSNYLIGRPNDISRLVILDGKPAS